jgi:regulator of protease activity HflC (stomatin/prohibitin superfamily)
MFSIIIFIASIVAGLLLILKGASQRRNSNFNDSAAKNEASKKIIRGVAVIVIGLIVSAVQPFALERIDAGNKGLKVNLTGTDRGVSSYQYKTGWVFYNSWTEQVKEFPLFQQHIEYNDQTVITKGGFAATIKPSFNYSLREDAIGEMFVNLRLETKEIEQGWLKNAIVSSVNDVANRWEVDAIFNKREEFEAAIITECNKRVSKWFTVSQLRTNIIPPRSLQQAIEGKTKAVQEAQAAMQRKLVAEAEAQEKIAIAKGDSAKAIIDAQALALSMKIKQRELTPIYVEYIKWSNWDGKLPTTVAGNSGTLLNIK